MKRLRYLVIAVVFVMAYLMMVRTTLAGVNDFVITSYKSDLNLGRLAENHSVLRTTETIVARFPDFDQNHGIERAIPKTYDGHSTDVQIISVTDQNDQPRTYSTYDDDNGNLVVRMADMDVYVHGEQTYKLDYVQRDVTKFFSNTNSDEFYWDINGTDWRVPIDRLEMTLVLDDSMGQRLTGGTACYKGVAGSSENCDLIKDGMSFRVSSDRLNPSENITIAIGFTPGTFAAYQMTLGEKLLMWWAIAQYVLVLVIGVVVGWTVYSWNRKISRNKEIGTIVPEYIPPLDYSVTASSSVAKGVRGSVMTAQLLDLAVRKYIKIYEVVEKSWFKPAEYEIEIARGVEDLRPEEKELLSDSFGSLPAAGERLNLRKLQNNMSYFRRTQDNDKKLRDLVRHEYGLKSEDQKLKKTLRKTSLLMLVIAVVFLSPVALSGAVVVFGLSFMAWPLTDKGLILKRYLEGIKMYIGVAEVERLKMLQSPDGVEKTRIIINSSDEKSLIKLYERALPYAVLFGQEKEWTKQLGNYYEQTSSQPDWYIGQSSFNAAAFSGAMSGLSQATSYASSSSSSSGGSGGGGSSGGGGGGGGGGGV